MDANLNWRAFASFAWFAGQTWFRVPSLKAHPTKTLTPQPFSHRMEENSSHPTRSQRLQSGALVRGKAAGGVFQPLGGDPLLQGFILEFGNMAVSVMMLELPEAGEVFVPAAGAAPAPVETERVKPFDLGRGQFPGGAQTGLASGPDEETTQRAVPGGNHAMAVLAVEGDELVVLCLPATVTVGRPDAQDAQAVGAVPGQFAELQVFPLPLQPAAEHPCGRRFPGHNAVSVLAMEFDQFGKVPLPKAVELQAMPGKADPIQTADALPADLAAASQDALVLDKRMKPAAGVRFGVAVLALEHQQGAKILFPTFVQSTLVLAGAEAEAGVAEELQPGRFERVADKKLPLHGHPVAERGVGGVLHGNGAIAMSGLVSEELLVPFMPLALTARIHRFLTAEGHAHLFEPGLVFQRELPVPGGFPLPHQPEAKAARSR